MPRIVRYGGLCLSDEAVKIRDVAPAPPGVRRPAVKAEAPDGDTFEPLDFGGAVDDGEDLVLPDGEDDAAEDFAGASAFEAAAAKPARSTETGVAQAEIIQAAMGEAGRIIGDAVKQAEDKKAEILAGAQYEADRMQQEAVAEGRKQGFAGVLGDMQSAADSLQAAVSNFEGERAGFEAEYEGELRWLSIEIASKVLAKKVDADDAEMTEMVDKAVQTVRSEPWIRIEVAQEMTRLIDSLTNLYDEQAGIEVSGIPAAPGTVHIETPSGVVDASLRTQLANLREYFSRKVE